VKTILVLGSARRSVRRMSMRRREFVELVSERAVFHMATHPHCLLPLAGYNPLD
jgi:hypothetical protein